MSQVVNLRQLGVLLAWGQLSGHMLFGNSSAGPPQAFARMKRGGALFPLPVNWPADFFPEVAQKLCHPLYRIFGRVLGGAFLRGTQLLVRFQATEPGASPGKSSCCSLGRVAQ